jgi:DNA-directed RNA polymerase subunit H
MKKPLNIQNHVLVFKHEKLAEEQKRVILEKYNISLRQLPAILKSDPAIYALDARPGDMIEITRNSPTIVQSKFYRVVING